MKALVFVMILVSSGVFAGGEPRPMTDGHVDGEIRLMLELRVVDRETKAPLSGAVISFVSGRELRHWEDIEAESERDSSALLDVPVGLSCESGTGGLARIQCMFPAVHRGSDESGRRGDAGTDVLPSGRFRFTFDGCVSRQMLARELYPQAKYDPEQLKEVVTIELDRKPLRPDAGASVSSRSATDVATAEEEGFPDAEAWWLAHTDRSSIEKAAEAYPLYLRVVAFGTWGPEDACYELFSEDGVEEISDRYGRQSERNAHFVRRSRKAGVREVRDIAPSHLLWLLSDLDRDDFFVLPEGRSKSWLPPVFRLEDPYDIVVFARVGKRTIWVHRRSFHTVCRELHRGIMADWAEKSQASAAPR